MSHLLRVSAKPPPVRYAVGIDGEVDGDMTLEVVGKRGNTFRSLTLRGINIYPAR